MNTLTIGSQSPTDRNVGGRPQGRRGAILILMVSVLLALFGMLGLVFDAGLLMSQTRQAQNVADAAVLAAAKDLLAGRGVTTARQTATKFIVEVHGFPNPAAVDIRIPPTTGPYAGSSSHVEVIVRDNARTHFIGFLPGMGSVHQVSARAVAGYEAYAAGEGVIALNPNARPGISLGGNASLSVDGKITVNSEGGGVDEFGLPINNGNSGTAMSTGPGGEGRGIFARVVQSVGGVDTPANVKPYALGDPNPLMTRALPEPDPMINLPTPMVSNGVDSRFRGSVTVNSNNVTGLGGDTTGQNRVAVPGESIAGGLYTANGGEVILHPGVYSSLTINSGSVIMIPGIYVLQSTNNNQTVLSVNGGSVMANGIMFYVTGSNYQSSNGMPDVNDGELPPPITDGATLGRVTLNAGLQLGPIDTSVYDYGSLYQGAVSVGSEFDGMLFYQRRRSTQTVTIGGNSAAGALAGTMYAKWAEFNISGQGTYDAQFISGSTRFSGQGTVRVLSAENAIRGRAALIYLVE